MPDKPRPPFESGALTVPRQLNRWLDVNAQGGPLKRCQTYIELPAFAVADSWYDPENSYSDIVFAVNFEASNNFSLKTPISAPENPNYVLCISWHEGGVIRRYLLWDAIGSNLNQNTPVYTGQLIKKNFRFEVWNTSQGAVSEANALRFYTSKRQSIDYRFGSDITMADGVQVTAFQCEPDATVFAVVTPDATFNDYFYYTDEYNGRPRYMTSDTLTHLEWDGIYWNIIKPDDMTKYYYGGDDAGGPAQPNQVGTTWVEYNYNGGSPTQESVSPIYVSHDYVIPLQFPADSISKTN